MTPLTSLSFTLLTFVTLILTLSPLASFASIIPFRTRKVISVEYFENCENKVYPLQFVGWSFVRNRTLLTINGEEVVLRDINDPMTISYRIEKCRDRSNPDICEYYNTWKFENLCATIKLLPFLEKYQRIHSPTLTCPFKKDRNMISLEYFEDCNKKLPIQFAGWSFTRNGSQLIVKGEEIISRDISDPLTCHFRVHKCADRSNAATCEYYNKWKFEDFCKLMRILPFTKEYLDIHTPPLSCPYKKGHYYLRNWKYDAKALARFMALGTANNIMWKLRILTMEKNQTAGCIDAAFRFAEIRGKH